MVSVAVAVSEREETNVAAEVMESVAVAVSLIEDAKKFPAAAANGA